jgi:hypothetical protein
LGILLFGRAGPSVALFSMHLHFESCSKLTLLGPVTRGERAIGPVTRGERANWQGTSLVYCQISMMGMMLAISRATIHQ